MSETKIKKSKKVKQQVPAPTPDERDAQYVTLRHMVKNMLDIERLRMQTAGRINRTSGPEVQLSEGAKSMQKVHAERCQNLEDSIERDVVAHMRTIPFYREVLKDMPGIGVGSAAIILSSFDIKRADTVSKMWAFAGLRPMPARRCRTCHRVVEDVDGVLSHPKKSSSDDETACKPRAPAPNTYESGEAQHPKKGMKLPYNAFLRARLLGGLGHSLIKLQDKTPYAKIYADYKHRKLTQGWGVSDGHRHHAAIRYMIKQLLLDVWKAWRAFEGLPVRPSYHEEKQGGHGFVRAA